MDSDTISLDDYLVHIRPGPGASGDWLRALPERLILGLVHVDALACRADQTGRDAAAFISEILLALLRAENDGVAEAPSIAELVKWAMWIGAAAKTEFWRREGQIVVNPPIRSLFDPIGIGSKVYPVDVAEA